MPPVLMLPQLIEGRVQPIKGEWNQPYSCHKTIRQLCSEKKGQQGNSRNDYLWRLAMGICVVVVGVIKRLCWWVAVLIRVPDVALQRHLMQM
jgi:hypothetical protein